MHINHTYPSHPHAQVAVLLASFNRPDRAWINRTLAETGTPRHLYTLARVLRAAQQMDEMDAMDRIPVRLARAA